ncbi:invasion associated locus B family protein [Terasakiella pusilla]|jgi:invasion protein IalB|uniref:invasion associated locus B family protein n=1 Tax=Terasakiella pusilla TaxID=64973 RepID=UPI003AA8045C
MVENMVFQRKNTFLVFLLGLCVLFASQARAQEVSAWKKDCVKSADSQSCRISQQLFLSQKSKSGQQETVGRVLGLTVLYVEDQKSKKRTPYMSVSMPLGVDLRPGAVLKIDKGQDISIEYLRCTQSGCDASIELTKGLLNSLKAGSDLFVGFRPWGSEKVAVLKATLSGFSKAFNSIK